MTPYPKELRTRVVAAVEQGDFTIPEVASIFNVGITFVKKMLKLHRAGDDLQPRHAGGPEPSLKEKELTIVRQEIQLCPDATLEELQKVLIDRCKITVSLSTICRALQQLDLPRKKKVSNRRSAMKKNVNSFVS